MPLKLLSVVGARPQLIKSSILSLTIEEKYNKDVDEILVHTGQHFDHDMSGKFFKELNLKKPRHFLNINGGSQASMVARMLIPLEDVLKQHKPDFVVVFGDTNSTLSSALAASYCNIKLAHVEAGLRSGNRTMPEETNRIVTDSLSSRLYCPSELALKNLLEEGRGPDAFFTGDVMLDLFKKLQSRFVSNMDSVCEGFGLKIGEFSLVTMHRAQNVDDKMRLKSILEGLNLIADYEPLLLPVHPRTKARIEKFGLSHLLSKINICQPLGYCDFQSLNLASNVIITDSGGVQKEAFFAGTPAIIVRDETEWMETVSSGNNILVEANAKKLEHAYLNIKNAEISGNLALFGDGRASEEIIKNLLSMG